MIQVGNYQILPSAAELAAGLMRSLTAALGATNPWPGLAAYDEASSAWFHGRRAETAELLRLVRAAPVTLLYGAAGLGKSSLLQAGLMPGLRRVHALPVYLRLDGAAAAGDEAPLALALHGLDHALRDAGADSPAFESGDDLWRYLHRDGLALWSRDNHPLEPVFIFDQCETLFAKDDGAGAAMLAALGDLIENRLPAALGAADTPRAALSRYDLRAQPYRIVLACREDALPEIERWADQVPSLRQGRLRLGPMSHAQAVEAVQRAGAAVLAPDTAAGVVDAVARASPDAAPDTIEPMLLSLFCQRLSRRRSGGAKIDAALLGQAGGEDILATFYREAMHEQWPHVESFVQYAVANGPGPRGGYPRDEALRKGLITAEELSLLSDGFRLLRIAPNPGGEAMVELGHERLMPVVRRLQAERERLIAENERKRLQSQLDDERRAREAAEQMQRKLARRCVALAVLSSLLLAALLAGVWWVGSATARASHAGSGRLAPALAQAVVTGLRDAAHGASAAHGVPLAASG